MDRCSGGRKTLLPYLTPLWPGESAFRQVLEATGSREGSISLARANVNTPPPKGGGFNYGSKPDWSAFGGHGASLGDVEVVVRCRGRLVLDVVNPHLVGMAATLVRFHQRRDPIRLKAWGFAIPYRGL